MLLGELIKHLEALDPELEVRFGNSDYVGRFTSYRGIYAHLALENGTAYHSGFEEQGYVKHETVGELLETCKGTVGQTFQGYKGGDYEMGVDAPIWLAEWGESSGIALVDVVVKHGDQGQDLRAVLVGHDISEYLF